MHDRTPDPGAGPDDPLTRALLDASAGDRLALSQVVRQLYPDVVRYCASRVSPDVAEDVAQEVFLRLTRTIGGYEGRASARTWVFVIARNTCADAVRSRVRRRGREAPTTSRPDDALAGGPPADDGHALRALLHELDPDRREAFELTQLVGCSYREAAEVAGVPIGTIRSRVARARGDLVRLLREAERA